MALFTVLCEQYQPTLKRDPSYTEVKICHPNKHTIALHFHYVISPPKSRKFDYFINIISFSLIFLYFEINILRV